jgi:hypothetical protein
MKSIVLSAEYRNTITKKLHYNLGDSMNIIVERLMNQGFERQEAIKELKVQRNMAKRDIIPIEECLMDMGCPPTEEFYYAFRED